MRSYQPLAFSILWLIFFFWALQATSLSTTPTAIDRIPSNFEAIDLSGRKWKKGDLVILIDFWASWYGPCLEQIQQLKKLYEKYHSSGFEILGVSLDTSDRLGLERSLRQHRID